MADQRDSNGNGWKTWVIGALWGVILLVVGWIATDATSARSEMEKQIKGHSERIAVLEEANRNNRYYLERIERIVSDVQQTIQERRR